MVKKKLSFLFLSIISLILLSGVIWFTAPNEYVTILDKQFNSEYFFFILLSLFLFSAITYLSKSKKHGFLIALFVIIYLIFRLTNLTHPFFFILLSGLFLTLELLFSYRK